MSQAGYRRKHSPRHVGRLLEEAQIKPHQIRYWLTPRTRNLTRKLATLLSYIIAVGGSNKENAQYVSMKWREFRLKNVQKRPTSATWESSKNRIWVHPSWNTDLNFNCSHWSNHCSYLWNTRTESDFAAHICTTIKNDPDASKWDLLLIVSTPTNPNLWYA